MKFGVILPSYDRSASWEALKRTATMADELGYDSLWTTDHLLVPKENASPYGTIFEAMMTLALVAGFAPRVALGTSVIVLPMRNAVLLAKQAAALDVATEGRFILGVGVGWNEKEYRNLSADFHSRGKRLDEGIELLRRLWSSQEVSFSGNFTTIADGYSSPLPIRSGIPIWVGGNGEPSLQRVAKLGDGWHTTGASPDEMAQGIQRIKELGPARRLTFSARLSLDFDPAALPTYEYLGNKRYRLAGKPDAIVRRLREYARAGVELVVLVFPWERDLQTGLEHMQRFANEIVPELRS